MIQLFTDGACRGNPGPGGWAAILEIDGESRELSGAAPDTTNNRMELTAAIEGLGATPDGATVEVISDSKYVIDGITQWIHGWKRHDWKKSDRKPVLNQDLWQALSAVVDARQVTWRWVQGHTGHPENERCDVLANQEVDRLLAQ